MKWSLLVLSILTMSCQTREFKYQIYNPNYLDSGNSAYFLTDTFEFKSDTMFWINSDRTKTIISVKGGNDCKIIKIK